jgi:GWxTD domain-containing protein
MQRLLSVITILVLISFGYTEVNAQRGVSYQDLLERSEQPNIYLDYNIFPAANEGALFSVSFRMDNDLLPFRRVRPGMEKPTEDAEYYATARMSLEIFRGSLQGRRQNFEPVTRSSWADTAWVETFEQTRSRIDHLQGMISTELEPGEYSLFLDLNRDGSQRHARSRERSIEIPEFQSHDKATLTLLESADESDESVQVRLLNFGEYVLYGQNYQLMLILPADADSENYSLKIERLSPGSDSQTEGTPYFEVNFTESDLFYMDGVSQLTESKNPEFEINKTETGFPVYITNIPNSEFPNTRFKITVEGDGKTDPYVTKNINSRWIDMPVSLLNLDVAINMLRFIADDSQIREMRRGSAADRERKFREFWAERDPTPDTEFNELMAEYYKRIDQAYNNYTTPERPGFDSDQGRAYILYGEPVRKERTYPTDGPTREIWVYRNRTLVFEATTGFGDFRLVQQ